MLRAVRALVAWLAVNAFFVAINVVAAGLIFGLFALGKMLVPDLMDEPLLVIPLGLAGVAGAIWLAYISVRALNARPLRGRGRGRA
jgi:hypothetical protein